MAEDQHKHKFTEIKDRKVLLHDYRSEDGVMQAVNTTGYDILKQHVCMVKIVLPDGKEKVCGAAETFDLQRTKVT